MVLRLATDADIPAVTAIYNHAVVHTTATAETVEQTAKQRMDWFRECTVMCVSVEGDIVTGYGAISPYNKKPGYRYTVENSIYVHPEHQGKGIGKALLQWLIDYSRSNQIRTIVASVSGDNIGSIVLHERFGFVETGRLPNLVFKFDTWLDCVYLTLDLSS